MKSYLEEQYGKEDFTTTVTSLRDQATKDKADGVEGVVEIPVVDEETDETKATLIEAVAKNISWQMKENRSTDSLHQVTRGVWKEGFSNNKVKGK